MATRTRTQKTTTQRGGKMSKAAPKKVKAPPTPAMVPVRISGDLIERIDAIRPDMIPREPFVRHVLDIGLTQLEEEG